jgi:plastocyanin
LSLPVFRRSPARPIRAGLWLLALGLAVAGAITSGACGSGSSSPTTLLSPSPTATPPPGGGVTVNISADVVSPKLVEVNVGQRVAFVNNDTVAHEIASDPHPIHTDCPPINEVGGLAPGQGRLTGVFTIARTCGYHDHGEPTNTNMQGMIVIH